MSLLGQHCGLRSEGCPVLHRINTLMGQAGVVVRVERCDYVGHHKNLSTGLSVVAAVLVAAVVVAAAVPAEDKRAGEVADDGGPQEEIVEVQVEVDGDLF